jgi:hypothetical protein
MKSTIKYAVLLVMAFTLFLSCNQEKSTKKDTDPTDPPIIGWEPCKSIEEYGAHEIDKDSAETSLKLYKDYIDSVKNCLDPDAPTPCVLPGEYEVEDILNYGSEVDFDLLLQVLMTRKLDCEHKLFLMNAIRPARDEEGKIIEGKLVNEIIFVHEADTIVTTAEKTNKTVKIHTYFDFTRPCPNGCPKEILGIEYPEL